MPRAGSGAYTLPAGNPVVTNTPISSVWANNTMSDLATEITSSLDRSGRGAMLAALQLVDGLVGTPGLTFAQEPTSGVYRIAAGRVGVGVLGTLVGEWNANGLVVTSAQNSPLVDVNSTHANGSYYRVARAGANFGYFGNAAQLITGGANTDNAVRSDGNLDFSAGGATRSLRIMSTGPVVVNSVTNVGVGSGTDPFAVNGNISFQTQLNAGPGAGLFAELVNRSATGGWKIYCDTGGVVPFQILGTSPYTIIANGIAQVRQKTSSTSRNTTTTATDDPDLVIPLAVGTYHVDADLWWAVAASGGPNGAKVGLAFSGTATGSRDAVTTNSVLTTATTQSLTTQFTAASMSTSATPAEHFHVRATIVVTVAGNLSVQWAQNASGAQNLTLFAGSSLRCTKVAG